LSVFAGALARSITSPVIGSDFKVDQQATKKVKSIDFGLC